jgi:3'(2'), 5'-bisphosphate nucleotidase
MGTADEKLAIMLEAVRTASRIVRAVGQEGFEGRKAVKADRSPVTVGDLAAQAVVSARLARAFPGVPLLAEESAGLLCEPEAGGLLERVVCHVRAEWPAASAEEICGAIDRGAHHPGGQGGFFTLDPIDGTKGFLRGGQYSVALAYVESGEPTIGVLACPKLALAGNPATVLIARRGGGTTVFSLDGEGLNGGTTLRVSDVDDPGEGRLVQSVEREHGSPEVLARVAGRLGLKTGLERVDSQVKYAIVAAGLAEVYLKLPGPSQYEHSIWDHAAGSLLVTEAGGKVTDLHGRPLDFSRGRNLGVLGLLATNGRLHAEVLAAVSSSV